MSRLFILSIAFAMVAFGSNAGAWKGAGAWESGQRYQANSIVDGEYSDAEARLVEQLAKQPDNTFAMLNLAAVYQQTGRSEQARELYQKVMKQKDNPHAMLANRRLQPVKTIARKQLETMGGAE